MPSGRRCGRTRRRPPAAARHPPVAGAQTGDRTLAAFLRIPRPVYDLVFGREWFRDPALPPGRPRAHRHLRGGTMSSRTKQILQTVIGLGLAAAMLIWGLPYFAKTSWTDIWSVIRTIPLSHALALPGADAARAVVLHLHLHRLAARAEPRQGTHREPVRVLGVEPAARRRCGRPRGDLRDLPVLGLLAPGHVDVGHRHRRLERAGPHRTAGRRHRRAVVRRRHPSRRRSPTSRWPACSPGSASWPRSSRSWSASGPRRRSVTARLVLGPLPPAPPCQGRGEGLGTATTDATPRRAALTADEVPPYRR